MDSEDNEAAVSLMGDEAADVAEVRREDAGEASGVTTDASLWHLTPSC